VGIVAFINHAPLLFRSVVDPIDTTEANDMSNDLFRGTRDAHGRRRERMIDIRLGGHPKPATDGYLKTGHRE
jgi:hypothetical protein